MAKQKQGKTLVQEQEYRFNRQINYYIMRHMWQVVCGRDASDRIYECFGMSRQRYTNAIKTGKIRCSDEEAKRLEQLTGVSMKVFKGEEKIELYFSDGTTPAISQEEWEKLFAWRNYVPFNGEIIGDKTGKEIEKEIHRKLKDASREDINSYHFYRLCYFLDRRKPAPLHKPDEQIRNIKHAIDTLSFELAVSCGMEQLKEIRNLLQEKSKMVSGIMIYRVEEKKAKGNQ